MNASDIQWLLFTDMDGTLLDHHDYSYEPAKPVLTELERRGIPVHIASSKTFAESIDYYREWGIRRPMIVENGASVALPDDQCDADWGDAVGGYRIRALATPYATLRETLDELRTTHGWKVEGFGDWSAEQVASHTGLTLEKATLAKQRTGTEPVLWFGNDDDRNTFRAALESQGLRLLQGGRFLHIMGKSDKATGVQVVLDWYRGRGLQSLHTLCLGDSENDRTMLEQANCTIVVQKTDSSHMRLTRSEGVIYSKAPSPKGWADSVTDWLDS